MVTVVVHSRSRSRCRRRRETKPDTVNSVDIASNTDAAADAAVDTRGVAPLPRHCFRRSNTPPVHHDYDTLDTRDEDSRASWSWS